MTMTTHTADTSAYALEARRKAEDVRHLTGWALPDGWGIGPVGHHRDSDVLTESNWETVVAMFSEISEEGSADERWDVRGDWAICRFRHWAVGWVEELAIRLDGPCLQVAADIADALEDYPVLDDEDHSEREYADALLTLTACFDVTDEDAPAVFRYLFDTYSVFRGEDIRDEYVSEARAALELEDEEG